MHLIKFLPPDKPVISESGITDVDTIITLDNLGFKGFLIGETFMKAQKPAIAFAEFMKQLKAKIK
jgi:indole-3-glycerol phosphate synthase